MTALILASGSPRRRQLLGWSNVALTVRPADIDERIVEGEPPVAYAERLATEKAAVGAPDELVLAADTVVHHEGQIFDKPADRAEARRHLEALSGGWHAVTTGVCLRDGTSSTTWSVTTEVRFRTLTPQEIVDYLATGEADDKAGAYGIQGRAGSFVAELRGSWTNVMGLPMASVLDALRARGVA